MSARASSRPPSRSTLLLLLLLLLVVGAFVVSSAASSSPLPVLLVVGAHCPDAQRLPHHELRVVGGRSALEHVLDRVRGVPGARAVLSADQAAFAVIAREAGVEFRLRPPNLSPESIVFDALGLAPRARTLVWVDASAALVDSGDLERAVRLLDDDAVARVQVVARELTAGDPPVHPPLHAPWPIVAWNASALREAGESSAIWTLEPSAALPLSFASAVVLRAEEDIWTMAGLLESRSLRAEGLLCPQGCESASDASSRSAVRRALLRAESFPGEPCPPRQFHPIRSAVQEEERAQRAASGMSPDAAGNEDADEVVESPCPLPNHADVLRTRHRQMFDPELVAVEVHASGAEESVEVETRVLFIVATHARESDPFQLTTVFGASSASGPPALAVSVSESAEMFTAGRLVEAVRRIWAAHPDATVVLVDLGSPTSRHLQHVRDRVGSGAALHTAHLGPETGLSVAAACLEGWQRVGEPDPRFSHVVCLPDVVVLDDALPLVRIEAQRFFPFFLYDAPTFLAPGQLAEGDAWLATALDTAAALRVRSMRKGVLHGAFAASRLGFERLVREGVFAGSPRVPGAALGFERLLGAGMEFLACDPLEVCAAAAADHTATRDHRAAFVRVRPH